VNLSYYVAGAGPPVVCIHGSFIADAFRPLQSQARLTDRYRVITYRRRGYGDCGGGGPVSFTEQADDCRALLARLGVERAHVVGHSFGGAVALELASSAPDLVGTLAVIEPGLAIGESGDLYRAALRRSIERYREVGARLAVEEFLALRWPRYRDELDAVLPGAFDQAVADAATCFDSELPAVIESGFGEAQARRITQPTLVVVGGDSLALDPRFGETYGLLLEWLPNAEGVVVPGTTHLLHIAAPDVLADALVEFYARLG
jgi:pimeloyl-ACP methyl ester carboxylesterase